MTPEFKRKLLYVVGAIALFCGGVATGRFGTPAKVVEKIVYQDKVVEKVVYQDKIVIQKVYVEKKATKKRTETTTTEKPNGEKETKTVTEEQEDTDTKTDEKSTQEKIVYVDRVIQKLVEKTKLVEAKKLDWHISAGIGYAIPTVLGQQQIGTPGLQGVVVNAEIDRRIVGPFYIGLWGNTQGTVGLSLSGSF